MTRRLLTAIAALGAAAIALVVFAMPASAELRTFRVRLPTGQIVTVSVDAPAGLPMTQVPGLPGVPIQELTPPPTPSLPLPTPTGTSPAPSSSPPPSSGSQPSPSGGGSNTSGGGGGGGNSSGSSGSNGSNPASPGNPRSTGGHAQPSSGSAQPTNTNPRVKPKTLPKPPTLPTTPTLPIPTLPGGVKPNFFDTLPGPVNTTSVPNFVINNFRMPIFLLPIYQAAGIEYGVRWEVLAGINEIETDYGRDLSVSSAGALGWMQFMPDTWKTYGVDANGDGKRDPYNPADAIFAAARYLKAAGADKNLRQGIFAYNHANWYVDSVMVRAQLLASYPADFIASLAGLTEGRFPVVGKVKYGQDVLSQAKQVHLTDNATSVDNAQATRTDTQIQARVGSPVIAANDGVIKAMGVSRKYGRYIVLQDVYGNQYTYSELGSVQKMYPVPAADAAPTAQQIATDATPAADPRPTQAASAGSQTLQAPPAPASSQVHPTGRHQNPPPAQAPPTAYKARLFAHPQRAASHAAGGAAQILAQQLGTDSTDFATYSGIYTLNGTSTVLAPLRVGATVAAGTMLGRVGQTRAGQPPQLRFQVQPAGKGAPDIDPKPILDGWLLLERTNIYRPSGQNVLYRSGDSLSVGQVLLLSKEQLQRRVLSDPRVKIYACGRQDIQNGQIDRRVLASIEFLAESGLYPTVSSLKCGHTEFTSGGSVSEHMTGNAVDISAINGTPVKGHQQAGGVVDQAVRRLMQLQGEMAPRQIESTLALGGNTVAMPNSPLLSIVFQPLFGPNAKLGHAAISILKANQWTALASRLDTLSNPNVSATPSRYALPAPSNSGH